MYALDVGHHGPIAGLGRERSRFLALATPQLGYCEVHNDLLPARFQNSRAD